MGKKKTPDKEKDFSFGNILEAGQILFNEYDEVLEKEVKKFTASGSHIILPSKHEGKLARVLIRRKKKEEKKTQTK